MVSVCRNYGRGITVKFYARERGEGRYLLSHDERVRLVQCSITPGRVHHLCAMSSTYVQDQVIDSE